MSESVQKFRVNAGVQIIFASNKALEFIPSPRSIREDLCDIALQVNRVEIILTVKDWSVNSPACFPV